MGLVQWLAHWICEPIAPSSTELWVYVQRGVSSISLISLSWLDMTHDVEGALSTQSSIHPSYSVLEVNSTLTDSSDKYNNKTILGILIFDCYLGFFGYYEELTTPSDGNMGPVEFRFCSGCSMKSLTPPTMVKTCQDL